MKRNTLYYGDCLEVMREWPDACVDLIYLDPPFNSNADYNMLFGRQKSKTGLAVVRRKDIAQFLAFTDIWEWDEESAARVSAIKKSVAHPARGAVMALDGFFRGGNGMLAYLVYMSDRIAEMHRVLKDTGSFYLHCDPAASHYLKMILDCVFGVKNFRNEIVWHYNKWTNAAKYFQRNHDILFLYTKSAAYRFHKQFSSTPHKDKVLEKGWDQNVAGGVRQLLVYDRKKAADQIKDARGKGRKVVYMDDKPCGVATPDVWADINYLASGSRERLGYRTQKPIALLDRIIAASSNEGDVVLDPFCGCGTTVEAAMNAKRDYIGIDISMYALDVIQHERLKNTKFIIQGTPFDFSAARDMARKRPFAFEKWAVHRIAGFVSNSKQSGDGGVDGWAALLHPPAGEDGICIAQVKGGAPNVNDLKAMLSQLNGGYASLGVFITLSRWDTPTVRKCIIDAGQFPQGAEQYNRLVVWSIAEHFDGIAPTLPARAHPRTGEAFQIGIPDD
ncbi:MAG: DNA methyltransferase [Gammaproteobacteria bacterium]